MTTSANISQKDYSGSQLRAFGVKLYRVRFVNTKTGREAVTVRMPLADAREYAAAVERLSSQHATIEEVVR